ncbi:DUF1631 domain-containing protein [Pseudomonas sp. R5(2019)]|uniref:DUF1631 domain-containing protein n=1 Tax=Pseudomonas sp. R5(2019) TaxID=2697566 RepID=UPI0014137208|nr:DUF1631 domain-containing protein [Pseudomonas sp. R5(2019)]NBA97873.1 DUF1631 family protein [Pseudomonas sp. R5(2019)]
MHNDGKVVPLQAAHEQSTSTSLVRLPVVLLQVRDQAVMQLRKGLQSLFDNADDTLFEMADKANKLADQNTFFEAMRDLRLKRKSIERGFIEKLQQAFIEMDRPDRLVPVSSRTATTDTLMLVANDELERTVAVDAMVDKVLARDGLALRQLTTRFSTLMGRPLQDPENPLAPGMLCECFLQSGRSLGVVIKVKLIVLKLFEKYVLNDVGQLYAEANQLLIATGVLPELAAMPNRRSVDRRITQPRGPVAVPGRPVEAAPPAFARWEALLAPLRGRFARRGDGSANVQPISSRDLMRLLSHLQQFVPVPDAVVEFDLRDQLEQMLSRLSVKSGTLRVLSEFDEDVLNLMALLFEAIDRECGLPAAIKALIVRLQIPLLKVALSDREFLDRPQHPARRLLNEVASAALGWDGQQAGGQDGFYLRVEQLVQRLLDEYADDPTIFTELLAEFLAFNSDERRRSELLEQRTRDAEEGRANAERGCRRVEDELNRRLLGKTLPDEVLSLIERAWSQYLLLAWLKHGETSAQWREGLATLDLLVWSVGPGNDPDFQLRLLERVPGLLKALRDGLTHCAFDPFATREFFARLEVLHVQAFEPQIHDPQAPQGEQVTSRVRVERPIVLGSVDAREQDEAPISLAREDAQLLRVDTLRPGRWFEIAREGEPALRCKLAAVIAAPGKYVFVNRTGMKVLEMTRMELAVALRRGIARQLDDSLLFDRALATVRASLENT